MKSVLVSLGAIVCAVIGCSAPDANSPSSKSAESPAATDTPPAPEAEAAANDDAVKVSATTSIKQRNTAVDEDGEVDDEDEGTVTTGPARPTRPFVRITTPLFDESPDKIEIKQTTWALATPFADGERLGLVSGNTPIKIKSHVKNDDCETPWVEVAPRGFVCMEAKPAREPRKSKRSRKKKKKRGLIGSYAIAAKGARFFKSIKSAEAGKNGRAARGDMLRLGKTVTLEDGRKFRRTDRGEYIATSDIRRLYGSKFAGVELPATLSAPAAFAVNARNVKSKVVARRSPTAKARVARRIKPRTLVSVLEISEDELFARVGDGQWVSRADLREIEVREPPAEVGEGVDTRWADIDLDKQLVVVYDGRTPVFATLASTGREKDRTPTGVFRVTRKKKRTTMRSDRSRRQTYSAAVPWSTYFHKGIAFHTAYWHDTFGKARSHGCVNLSPSDARTVYQLLGPEVPEGWSVVYGHASQRGSVVQVRSVRPNPVPPEPETAVANR